jgi:hypothetical protein
MGVLLVSLKYWVSTERKSVDEPLAAAMSLMN